jgi:hypothetical protein
MTRTEFKFDGEVDEKSIKEKVDTKKIWTTVVNFYKNGMPLCTKYIDVSKVPVSNVPTSSSSSSRTTIQNGNIVRNPTYSDVNNSSNELLLDDFELKIKITFQQPNLRTNVNDDLTRYKLNVNAYTLLEKIYERVGEKYGVDPEFYTYFAVTAGKVYKDSKMPINKIIQNVDALLHIVISKRIKRDDGDDAPKLIEYPNASMA